MIADTRQGMLAALLRKRVLLKYAPQVQEHLHAKRDMEPIDWIESNFYTKTGGPIQLELHQKGIIRIALMRQPSGRFRWALVIYSTVKKAGKSTISAAVGRYMSGIIQFAEIYFVGNDFDQARGRGFKEAKQSIEMTPGFRPGRDILPGQWVVHKNTLKNMQSGSEIRAIAVDSRGEAGGHPTLSVWTELWGAEHDEALDFWTEMGRDPTQLDSMRWVETYAGYDGESKLLWGLYETATLTANGGRHLTNHEFATLAARDVDGERYEDFLFAFEETAGNPEALVPLYINEQASQFTYWDDGPNARRMPWLRGEEGAKFYADEEGQLLPSAFRHLHFNEWVGAESSFVPIELWDRCYDPDLPELAPDTINETGHRVKGDPGVLALDAAATGDCFAAVFVSRHPLDHKMPAIRKVKIWSPEDFADHRINFDEVEEWIRTVCKAYNVAQIAYDPYQLEDMMQRLNRERVAWCEEFSQGQPRLEADRGLYDRVMQGRLAHAGDPVLRQHILNSAAKLQKDEDSKLRIIKKTGARKIDAAVAASMGVARAMYLNI